MGNNKLTKTQLADLQTSFEKICKKITTDRNTYENVSLVLKALVEGHPVSTMNPEERARLQVLMSLAGHTTLRELIDNALIIYEAIVNGIVAGKIVALYDLENHKLQPITTPMLSRLQKEVKEEE